MELPWITENNKQIIHLCTYYAYNALVKHGNSQTERAWNGFSSIFFKNNINSRILSSRVILLSNLQKHFYNQQLLMLSKYFNYQSLKSFFVGITLPYLTVHSINVNVWNTVMYTHIILGPNGFSIYFYEVLFKTKH